MKIYLVGGYVRDEILGVPSKDMDYTVVLEESDMTNNLYVDAGLPFHLMVVRLKEMGFKIFLETPEFFTVRAQFPNKGMRDADANSMRNIMVRDVGTSAITADFVLARKESGYADGRRPDSVEIGTLEDDLARRDFTMNAIAKTTNGYHIDPYDGRADIANRVIRAVGDPKDRLTEDALRAVRAIRFAVTKGFTIEPSLAVAMVNHKVLDALSNNISVERIDEEMRKAFRFDTLVTLRWLEQFPALRNVIFRDRLDGNTLRLEPSLKQRGRGK